MLFIKKCLFLITFFYYFYYCLVCLSVSRSGPSVYCFSVCQVYLSVWSVCQSFLFIILVCPSFWSVCLNGLSVCLSTLSVLLCLCRSGRSVSLVSFFLSCFSFCLVFDGCFVCLSFWFVSPSVCLSISLYLYKIRLDTACWYLAIQSIFCLVCLSFLSFCIVCQSLSLISLSVRLYIFLVCLCLCLSIC